MEELSPIAGDLFQARAVQICFVIDQHTMIRFNELRRALGRISTRTLSEKLSFLQEQGLVEREQKDATASRVTYRLTARGRTFTNLLFPAIVHVGMPGGT